MMFFLFLYLLIPVCATFAGFIVWAINRGQSLDDGTLIRDFLIILAISLLLVGGAGTTDTVRLYLDPQFRLQTEMDAHPVYSTIKRVSPDDHTKLDTFLAVQMSHGDTLAEAFLQARPLLTQLTNQRSGWADQKTKLAWGRVSVDSLKELQAIDPMLCYRTLSTQPPSQQELAHAFSADNTTAFQQAVVKVYESSVLGISNKRSPDDEAPVEFNAAAREFYAIREAVAQRYGKPVAELATNKKAFPATPTQPPEKMCAARIFQLEAMLERPQAMAARLIDSLLR
ncbi:MAG: hypothetical protein B7Y40_02760 [Gammaproteobacteria bacterium 28-57-27]|nr:MAG: hypothetical protein B7Y40_02760 [Gammaproteobacteria bacterium 28-57-27]